MDFKNKIEGDQITVFADASLYSKDSIFKCLYWYGSKFHTTVSIVGDKNYKISIKPLSSESLTPQELEYYQFKLERDLIDHNLRDIVTKETQNIRDLLIAKAFSNGEFDELPAGGISDPVGFNPD